MMHTYYLESLEKSPDYLEIGLKLATIFIACVNLIFAIMIFRVKTKKDDLDKEKDRRIQWMKSLVLDHSLEHFYSFFEKIDLELENLKSAVLTDAEKSEIDIRLGDEFILLRRKFTDILISVDSTLYQNILSKFDDLQSHLTNSIFDVGINLSHSPKFDEIITEKVNSTKTDSIKVLFSYRG